MQKTYLFSVYFLCIHLFAEESKQPVSAPFQVNITQVQQTEDTRKKRCFNLFGDDLKECMDSLPKKKQKKLLAQGSKLDRYAYLKTLAFKEFEKFIDSFTEEEWQNFIAQLSKKEQKHWPPTLAEQKKKLQEIYDASVKQMYWDITKDVAFDVMMFCPMMPFMAFFIASDVLEAGKRFNDFQAEEFKNYIEEQFG